MIEKPIKAALATNDRVHAELLDSFDEELELEIDDDRLEALTNEFSGHPASETVDRRFYFKELFRLQGELVKLQDWTAAQARAGALLNGATAPRAIGGGAGRRTSAAASVRF